MRVRKQENGITVKAYPGNTTVMLAFDVIDEIKNKDFLGFAVFKEDNYRKYWLKGYLRFPGQKKEGTGSIDTVKAPIQKFRWSDYSVEPDSTVQYTVYAMLGPWDNMEEIKGPTISVTTKSREKGIHQVAFNRAVASSQAYEKMFGDVRPNDKEDPEYLKARDWLGKGMDDKLFYFIESAKGEKHRLDIAIYEYELEEITTLLNRCTEEGTTVRLLYHGGRKDGRTEINEEYVKDLKYDLIKARKPGCYFHHKFIVHSIKKSSGWEPQEVLTGSTNFTPRALYLQANVVHVVTDKKIVNKYADLFEYLTKGEGCSATKSYIENNNPIADLSPKLDVIFSPRKYFGDIKTVVKLIENTDDFILMCTAFNPDDSVIDAMTNNENAICYGLQNKKSKLTGYHRSTGDHFTCPTFLKKSIEDLFVSESKKTAKDERSMYIHLKTFVFDFAGENPIVITGSNNFSENASEKNDENMLIIRDKDVADIYACEILRFYDHYRFRSKSEYVIHIFNNIFSKFKTWRLRLRTDNSWTNKYYGGDIGATKEREYFTKDTGQG